MKTLVIHPKDYSTDFLSAIYKNKEVELIDLKVSQGKLESAIRAHDRVIMLGHGDPMGMYGFGEYVIKKSTAFYLRQKPQSIYIWCYASDFMKKHALKGFGTGMFISEYEEAMLLCIKPDYVQIQHSNDFFAKTLNEILDKPVSKIYSDMKKIYTEENNQTITYNSDRLYLSL